MTGLAAWGGSRLLADTRHPLNDYAPVLALTILDTQENGVRVLVGVRTAEANKTHQNVASVPTQRVSLAIARVWMRQLRRISGHNSIAMNRSELRREVPDLRREVSSVLARKLGLADSLELGGVDFDILQFNAWQGTSMIGESPDGPLSENLTMFNACIVLKEGFNLLPRATASYNPLVWATVSDFFAMIRSRDAGQLNAGLENSFVCAYGLCLETSMKMLQTIFPDPS